MKKKIGLIAVLSLVGLLAVAVILCSIIKVNFLPETKEPLKITIQSIEDSSKQAFYNTTSSSFNEEDYKKIVAEFKNSFNQSVISAMFNGTLGNQAKISDKTKITFTEKAGYKITFGYADYQNIKLNGEAYKNTSNTNEVVEFKELQFVVTEAGGFNNISIYYVDDSGATTYYYQLKTIANTLGLYNLINGLDNFQ